MRWGLGVFLTCVLVACTENVTSPTIAPTETPDDSIASIGTWAINYVGECDGRDSKSIEVMTLDDQQIIFEDFTLTLNSEGQYAGVTQFVAPMPADGRDILYTIAYNLTQDTDKMFSGDEVVVESGGQEIGCPIQLIFEGED